METTVKELPDSRVRVDVDVDPKDVEGSIKRTASELGEDMKMPGFRKGKVPPEMVVQRLGRETVLTQALESSLGDWYERAMLDSGINPVGDPKLDLSDLPDEGKPLKFSIEVAVRPGAELGEYKGLEVGREEPEVPQDAVEGELKRLQRGLRPPQPRRPGGEGGRRRPDRLRGQDRRRALRGRHRQGLSARAGGGPCAARAGEGSCRRQGRRRAHGRPCHSRTTIPPRRSPARPPSSTSRSKRSARRSYRSSTTTSQPRPPSSKPSPSFETTSPARSRDPRRPDRRALPRGRPRRRRRQRQG